MSKIWKLHIDLPAWVTAVLTPENIIVRGPKWELSFAIPSPIQISQEENKLVVSTDSEESRNLRWLVRAIVYNMVYWVNQWYEKKLLILWVWFWAKLEWSNLLLQVWFSHPVVYKIADWITVAVDKDPKWNSIVTIQWVDKQLVWQTASQIRDIKRPEPYKGKGIRYVWEVIKMKAWKSSKK